ncbi:HalOD1 output domain-containing protein [Natrononativus amylolyticus]|uniref:HalOD1 output domain-containing protein n=1 Tax=Natrononativus amylolyticus TaxID=2963434 RepID=UPI0020CE16DC|nr:HalOD1 output domain-containing protein [Natrononativus amylolyticus]
MPDASPAEIAVQSQYDWTRTSPSLAIVDAIAALENRAATDLPTALGVTLYDCVDPEALDTLVTASDEITLSFTVATYHVQIDGDELRIHTD